MKLIRALVVLTFLPLAVTVAAGETDYAQAQSPRMLAIQKANSASVSVDASGAYVLTLRGVAPSMILFAERPDRLIFTESTNVFMDTWTRGRDSFEVDPPNAALVLEAYGAEQEVLIAELMNPRYTPDAESLQYQLVIEGEPVVELPADFGEVTLVIDDYCCITGCSC